MNHNPHKIHKLALDSITPSLRYKGDDVASWQKNARAKLKELLGLDRVTPAKDDKFTVEYERELDGFTDRRITFQSENGYSVICHLWVPRNVSGKIPLVICLQGHSKGCHISLGRAVYPGDEKIISGGDRDFAVQVVREGFAALAIEQRGFGECGGTEEGPACYIPSMAELLYGRTAIGDRVFDISRAIDVITKNFDFIDADRVACLGNSGGGTATVYAAAIDERIKLAIPSCSVCTYKASIGAMYHCSCNFVPGIANYFDMGELCGLIAPRGLIIVSGAQDAIFPREGVIECVDVAKKYFNAMGASERIIWKEGEAGHRFYADITWPHIHELLK